MFIFRVVTFMHSGTVIINDSSCKKDIRCHIGKARGVLFSFDRLWRSNQIKFVIRKRLLLTLVWPIATYGCKSWTFNKKLQESNLM